MPIRLLLVILISTACMHLEAQLFNRAFNHINTENGRGLRSNVIYSLYQDPKGFIWLGTSSGLQRFDGGKFIQFDPNWSYGAPMPGFGIEQIMPADSGAMWLTAWSIRQVGIFNPAKYSYEVIPLRNSKPFPPRSEFKMWQDSYGNTYINVLRYGKIFIFDKRKREFTENTPLNNLPEGWLPALNTHHDKKKKQYWIATTKGPCVYDESTGQMWSREFNPNSLTLLSKPEYAGGISEVYIDKHRRHWIFYWTGEHTFNCYDENGTTALPDTAGLRGVNTSYAELAKFYEGRDSSLWLYGPGNLYSLDNGAHRFKLYRNQYLDNFGIRYNDVNQVIEDRDGMIWIATDQGLYYTASENTNIANIYLSDKPGSAEVTDIIELRSGHYWLSLWGGTGMITMDQKFRSYPPPVYKTFPKDLPNELIPYKQVWTMHQEKATGKVYLGCQAGRLMVYDTLSGKTEFLHPPIFDDRTIRYIAEDKQGRMWFGTQGGRVIRKDGEDYKVMLDLGTGAIIYKLLTDSEGWIWVCSQDNGVVALDPNTGRVLQRYTAGSTSKSLFANTAKDIEQFNDSLLAVSTIALNIINKKTGEVKHITTNDGLPSYAILRIRLDASGYLWIMTDNGICRYDHKKNVFTSYGEKDGILLGNVARSADYLCSENFVMFAGTNSLLFFNPNNFRSNNPPPDVTITDFFMGGGYQLLDSLQALTEITLKPDQNNFTISFSCLDFKDRDKFVYYYQMQGLSNDWVRAENLDVIFTGLRPGRYVFRVKAENTEGLQSKHVSELRIRIKPPFWQTGWFITTLIMLMSMVGYVMHRMRVNRLMAVEGIRNRVARDLHDDMGSTLSTINILSSMAKTKMHSDQKKAVEFINKISDNSQRMMEAMDDIVWAIKPANDSMQKLVARLREFATNVFEAKDIDIEFICGEEVNDVKLDMEARRDFFLVGKEAINNAAKYSKCSKVRIELQVINRELILTVHDNGIGFDVQQADGGNGMGNMQRRAAALRGSLHIDSAEGKGTKLLLSVPLP